MTSSALASGARGGSLTILSHVLRMLVQFAGIIVLSRMLPPSDFGLIAMVAVFVSLGELFRDFGMPTAAIQARELTHNQASNLFWINLALGALSGVLLLFATPVIVALYDEPRIAAVLPVLAATLVINGAQAQLQVQLARAGRFTMLAMTATAAPIVALGLAVAAAAAGWGYWALVLQLLAASAALFVMRAFAARWRPSLPRRRHGSSAHVRSGAFIGSAQFFGFIASNTDTVMLGWLWGSTIVGFYNRAFQLVAMPLAGLLAPLTQVVIPTLNKARAEGRNVFILLLKIQDSLGVVLIGGFGLALTIAPSLVVTLLGERWTFSIMLVQLLAAGECFHVLSYISYWMFLTEQKSRELFTFNLVTKSLSTALIVGAAFINVEAVAAAFAIGHMISWPANLFWLRRTADLNPGTFLRNGAIILVAAALAAACAITLVFVTHLDPGWAAMGAGGFTFCVVYVLCVRFLPGGRERFRVAASSALLLRRGAR